MTLPLSRRLAICGAIACALASSPALAHGPTPQKAEAEVVIAAPPEAVWKLVADFGAIAGWHPDVKSAQATGNGPGAERVLVLEKGEITDGLDEIDPAGHRMAYRLSKENVEAFPVSFYTATITVDDAGGGKSKVEWAARLYRGDTGNFPPDELNDEAATSAMTVFFEDGLKGLKAKAEGQPVDGKAPVGQ
ncbi:SRPBCC family protein [Xanthobacter agilis]|uniref:MxaD protein n=1 Tax=Xanthobacter agilis TaxID=47492 RepID=A0ABU0LAC2_XANAG|nr:SRPBCC family protein [Xanthobacter agilis]MDQ0504074.1 mxaD protein [Xanthobacter agilis]